MNDAEFGLVLEHRLSAIRSVLGAKGVEYSYGDRLSAFKRAAEIQRIPAQQVALNFLMKHFVSIQDMVESKRAYPAAQWNEKLGDAINYLILLEAIVSEATP